MNRFWQLVVAVTCLYGCGGVVSDLDAGGEGGGSSASTGGGSTTGGGSEPGGGSAATGGGSAATGGGSAVTGGGSAVTGGGSAVTGGGSAVTGGGSAVTGGGSAVTGGGSAVTGGGSAVTGGGSAVTGGGAAVTGGGSAVTGGGSAATGGGSAVTGGGSAVTGGGSAVTGGGSAATGGGSAVTGGGSAATGGGTADAGRPDAGFDAGRPDAGIDSGLADSGRPDSGFDAGFDAGPFDAGGPVIIPVVEYNESTARSVLLFARVNAAPAQIALYWATISGQVVYSHTVFRKLKSATSWGASIASLTASANSYIDSTALVGVAYEYKVERSTQVGTSYGYIAAGIEVPAEESRGKILLAVAPALETPLATELTQLQDDLEADGWVVVKLNVPSPSVVTLKTAIKNAYLADTTNVKALLLLGHLPVPYSGTENPDGHGDHIGAWPADTFYGDMDGTWTDMTVNMTNPANSFYNNAPNDGKYDQNDVPGGTTELQVGRIDLYNMDAFSPGPPVSEEPQRYRTYLTKLHNFKIAATVPQNRALIHDNFTGYTFAGTGWRNLSVFVGPANITKYSKETVPSTPEYYTLVDNQSYLWTYACGGGGYTQSNGIGTTWNFASVNTGGVFNMSVGSYFGDWDNNNNFLRAFISGGAGLTNMWVGIHHAFLHHMALGDTVGYGFKVTMNAKNSNLYLPLAGYGSANPNRQLALMGDPTLRMKMVKPPTALQISTSANKLNFTWTASTEAVLGYHVYQLTSAGPVRLTATPVTGTSFLSNLPSSTSYTRADFMVRAVKLTVSESGSYYNLSLGALNP